MRLLADSSIWIDHIRHPNDALVGALRHKRIVVHPFVIGEIALGGIKGRSAVLSGLLNLPRAVQANDLDVLDLVENHALFGTGIGYVDAHLLASTLLTPETGLWTRDRRLRQAAAKLGCNANVN